MDAVPRDDLRRRLAPLYGAAATALAEELSERIAQCRVRRGPRSPRHWTEQDTLLITYGHQLRAAERPSLAVLTEFLLHEQLTKAFSTVHLLPFFPYSSDDGFSVIDYRAVDPQVGSWNEVHALGRHFALMFDLVLNHASREGAWFRHYVAGQPPYDAYFVEADPRWDLSQVVRPRSLPLLTRVETSRGERFVWTTFSADQIDLNFATPAVLAEMVDILLTYVEQGASLIRLDAIAYLWKRPGTSCIHLPETHEVVKLLRAVLAAAAPDVWLLTETNVPHAENISYFGAGDEAHLVYQFSLPPLLLDAFLHQDARPFQHWLSQLQPAPDGTTFLNFTASHDGVGVRPLQGLVSAERFSSLVERIRERGGLVSTKRNADGSDSPYELNISYFDALGGADVADSDEHLRRFLSSQAIMLALQGIPAVYFHSLVGTPNHQVGVAAAGQPRRINRHTYARDELDALLAEPGSNASRVLARYRAMLALRRQQPAFSPRAAQRAIPSTPPWLLAFERGSRATGQHILVLANVSSQAQEYHLAAHDLAGEIRDLLANQVYPEGRSVMLAPFQTVWLTSDT